MSNTEVAVGHAAGDTALAVDGRRKEPPPETATERWTRLMILLSFWAVVILLGMPFWIWTTTVYRADLPSQSMNDWSDGKVCSLRFPLSINIEAPGHAKERITDFTSQISARLQAEHVEQLYLYQISALPTRSHADLEVTVAVANTPSEPMLGTNRRLTTSCTDLSSVCADKIASEIKDVFKDEQAAIAYLLETTAYRDAQVNLDSQVRSELEQRSIRAFRYASSYHLTFSLFSGSASPSAWQIEQALQQYLQPLVLSLSSISNFTIDTQVHLYSSISPSIAGPNFDEASKSWQLSPSDLSGFINAAEWPLSPSNNGGATINLVLYVPSPSQAPLTVAKSSRNSWIIPQWGGVQILNRSPSAGSTITASELERAIYTFAEQLSALIGLPPKPASLQLRVDALIRERLTSLILSTSSTLGALDKLTKKLESIAIPVSVAQSVDTAIHNLDQACKNLNLGQYQIALQHARHAEQAAEHAFFEPSMVGQVYFPDEHKVAVYVPLLGPMAVPLIMATLKEFKQWRARRAAKVKTT